VFSAGFCVDYTDMPKIHENSDENIAKTAKISAVNATTPFMHFFVETHSNEFVSVGNFFYKLGLGRETEMAKVEL
jgi:hypothetical protein